MTIRQLPITTFEQDTPVATFQILSDGAPFTELFNYDCELHIVDPEGVHQFKLELEDVGDGKLAITTESLEGITALEAKFDLLDPHVNYNAQIVLLSSDPPSTDIGLYDIIDPGWMTYVPPEAHVPGWYSGLVKPTLTIPTPFTWEVRESYRLRGAPNG
jgi:hypothetical protein